MSNSLKIAPELLDGYLAGSATPSEIAAVESWLDADPEHRALVTLLRSVDSFAAPQSAASVMNRDMIDIARAKEVLLERTRSRSRIIPLYTSSSGRETAPPLSLMPRFQPRAFQMVRIAVACLVGVVLLGTGAMLSGIRSSATASPAMEYETGNAQRATIQFADGTRVILNVGSRIQIPENFSQGNRTVRLTGEAYFDVAHAERSPFVVEAGGVRTRVLGTQFGVRAYRADSVQVAVRSGRVAMNDSILNAHEIAFANTDGEIIVRRDQRLDAALGFTTERLVLNGIPLRDAIADLNRWYDVDIQIEDGQIGDVLMYAVLRSGSIGELREILQNTFHVPVRQHGRVLTIINPEP